MLVAHRGAHGAHAFRALGVGATAVGLNATVGASSMTLGGLLKHMAYVEDDWFSRWLHGQDRQLPWDTADWAADPD